MIVLFLSDHKAPHLTCVKLLYPLGCWQQLGRVNLKKQCSNLQLHCGIRLFQYSDSCLFDSSLSDVSSSCKSTTVLLNGATLALSECKSTTVLLDGLLSSSKSQISTAVDSWASGVISPGGCTNNNSHNLQRLSGGCFLHSIGGEDDNSSCDVVGLFLSSTTCSSNQSS